MFDMESQQKLARLRMEFDDLRVLFARATPNDRLKIVSRAQVITRRALAEIAARKLVPSRKLD